MNISGLFLQKKVKNTQAGTKEKHYSYKKECTTINSDDDVSGNGM